MTDHTSEETALGDLFAEAREAPVAPPAALMARIHEDAKRLQPAPPRLASKKPAPARWRDIWQGLGGWPAFSGLATATVAGIWLGVNPPVGMALAAETYLEYETITPVIDLVPESYFDFSAEAL